MKNEHAVHGEGGHGEAERLRLAIQQTPQRRYVLPEIMTVSAYDHAENRRADILASAGEPALLPRWPSALSADERARIVAFFRTMGSIDHEPLASQVAEWWVIQFMEEFGADRTSPVEQDVWFAEYKIGPDDVWRQRRVTAWRPVMRKGTALKATLQEETQPGECEHCESAGECFNVKCHGAVGDGSTDDTAAFNAAFAADVRHHERRASEIRTTTTDRTIRCEACGDWLAIPPGDGPWIERHADGSHTHDPRTAWVADRTIGSQE